MSSKRACQRLLWVALGLAIETTTTTTSTISTSTIPSTTTTLPSTTIPSTTVPSTTIPSTTIPATTTTPATNTIPSTTTIPSSKKTVTLPLCQPEVQDAITKGLHDQIVRFRILDLNLDCSLSSGELALHTALRLNYSTIAEMLVGSYQNTSQQLWRLSQQGYSAIQLAANKGYSDCVKLLLMMPNVSVNATDPEGRNPLHRGVLVPAITRMLLDAARGRRPEGVTGTIYDMTLLLGTFDNAGDLPLHVSLRAGIVDSTTALLDAATLYARPGFFSYLASEPNGAGNRPVHLCSSFDIFKRLQSYGADLYALNRNGALPLHTASGKAGTSADGSLELLAVNLSINVRDSMGRTPLMYAAAAGDRQNTIWLVQRGALWNIRDDNGDVALLQALRGKHVHMIPLLVGTLEVLRAVISLGLEDVLLFLVNDQGYSVHTEDASDGQTPIFAAARVNRVDMGEFLVGKGAIVNLLDKNGLSPLVVGLAAGSFNASMFLLSKGAVVMQRVQNYSSALHVAAMIDGSHVVVEELIKRGAVVNAQDVRGWTPLHYAASGETAELLLSNNATALRTLRDGMFPLHTVARAGHAEALEKILVWRQSHVNVLTESNDSALHLASINQQESSAAVLLRFCVDYRLLNSFGRRAIEYAVDFGLTQTLVNADVGSGRCQCDCPVFDLGPAYRTYNWHGSCEASVTCRFKTSPTFQISCARRLPPNESESFTGYWEPAQPSVVCATAVSHASTRTAQMCTTRSSCFLVALLAYVAILSTPSSY